MCIRDSLAGFQLSRRIGCPCGISHFAGRLYLFRFQLEENLMSALVGKGKSTLGTEPLHIAGSNEALVQDNLITLQNQCARNTKLRDLVLGVGIGSDTAFYKKNPQGKELADWKFQRYMRDYMKTVK